MKKTLILSLFINIVFMVLVIRHFINQPKPVKSAKITYWLQRNTVLDKLPVDSGSVIFAGDSHVQDFELAELFNSTEVKNRGICYDTSIGLLNRKEELVVGNPSKVFIEIGVNDLNAGISIDKITSNIKAIIDYISVSSPKTKVYLNSVLPTKAHETEIKNLNKKLDSLATALKVKFINLDPTFFGDGGLKKQYDSGDGVHLNGYGYLKWRDILLPYVKSTFAELVAEKLGLEAIDLGIIPTSVSDPSAPDSSTLKTMHYPK